MVIGKGSRTEQVEGCTVTEVFCGIGGLTHGFIREGFRVAAGFDSDESCRYAYETNNAGAKFICKSIESMTADDLLKWYPDEHIKVLVGCAPCQPYSSYNQKVQDREEKWKLLDHFAALICAVRPEVVSMENVSNLVTYRNGSVYNDFVARLTPEGYHITSYPEVYCPDYGVPQRRTRLAFFASLFGTVELVEPTHSPEQYVKVRQAIGHTEPISAGEVSATDALHKASALSPLNLQRIRASVPGGTWRDWPEELIAECHKRDTGKYYNNVYGRMEWDELSPTITTQCYGFGNGRFGHPEQDRAISLREAALLQSFPEDYAFTEAGKPVYFKVVARHIGNAVPVELAKAIARSIKGHLEVHLD